MSCKKCGLCNLSITSCIPGYGKASSGIMVVNSYASEQDEEAGHAVIPEALQFRLKSIGVDPRKVYYTNAIKCACPKGTKFKVGDIKKCRGYLLDEIERVKPKFVLLLGAQAVKATVDVPITESNGVLIEKDGIRYMPSYSPGVVYRDPGKAPFVDQAFANFRSLVEGSLDNRPELDIRVITTNRELDRAFQHIQESGYKALSYDIETTGLNRFHNVVNLLGFGNDRVQYIIPLEAPLSPLRGRRKAQAVLVTRAIKWLNRHVKTLIAGNGKFDDLFLEEKFGVKPVIGFDVVLASHILNENTPNGVKENAILECNAPHWDVDKKLKTGKYSTPDKYQEYLTYLGYDIYYEYSLYKVFRKRIREDPSLYRLYHHLYMPGIRAYEEVERQGVYIYPEQFKTVEKHLRGQLEAIEKDLKKLAKCTINWSSTAQLQDLLYNKLKLPVIERTEAGAPSTGESTLKQLQDQHPIIPKLLEYRAVKIQITHFVDGWIKRMHKGRLYPNFKLHGTVTGRTSCLVGETPVMTPTGWTSIKDIKEGDLVYTYDDDCNPTIRRVTWSGATGFRRDIYRVYYKTTGSHEEKYIEATGDHLVRLTSGRYKRVDKLKGHNNPINGDGDHVLAITRQLEADRSRYRLHFTGRKGHELEHQFIFQSLYGYTPELVHHKDRNPLNNDPRNLKGWDRKAHGRYHNLGRDPVPMSKAAREVWARPGHRERMAQSMAKVNKRKLEDLSREDLTRALIQGNGILGAKKILGRGYEYIRRRMKYYGIEYDGRKSSNPLQGNHYITRVEKVNGPRLVYDISVEDTHCFIANEICVHNCTDPNLQQVPRDPVIRNLIGAPEGWSVVEIDYSQAELRIAAIMSGDETMTRIYQTGGDIHTHTYEMITGEKVSDDKYIRKEQRKKAKAVNFGFVYGMGWRKFQEYARDTYGVTLTEEESREWRERFFQAYHSLPKWHSKQRRIVQSLGQVRSPIGRIRRLPDIYSSDKSKKAEAERQSINSPVQGFGSDLTILGMSEIMGYSPTYDPKWELDRSKFHVIGTVHDATLFEVRNDYLLEFCPRAKHILEHSYALEHVFKFESPVPIIADVAVGKSWGAGIELHMDPGEDTWKRQILDYLEKI